MSSVNRPPSDPPGSRGPRRPGRTIDLPASEVSSEPAAPDVRRAAGSEPSAEALSTRGATGFLRTDADRGGPPHPPAGESGRGGAAAETSAAPQCNPAFRDPSRRRRRVAGPVGSVPRGGRPPQGLPWRLIGIGRRLWWWPPAWSSCWSGGRRSPTGSAAALQPAGAGRTAGCRAHQPPDAREHRSQDRRRSHRTAGAPRSDGRGSAACRDADPALANRIGTLEGASRRWARRSTWWRGATTISLPSPATRARAPMRAAAAAAALPKTARTHAARSAGGRAPARSRRWPTASLCSSRAAKALQAELARTRRGRYRRPHGAAGRHRSAPASRPSSAAILSPTSSPPPKRSAADAQGARAAGAVRGIRGALGIGAQPRVDRPAAGAAAGRRHCLAGRNVLAAAAVQCGKAGTRAAARCSPAMIPTRCSRASTAAPRSPILPARSPNWRSCRRRRGRRRRPGSPRRKPATRRIEASRKFAADALAALGQPSALRIEPGMLRVVLYLDHRRSCSRSAPPGSPIVRAMS